MTCTHITIDLNVRVRGHDTYAGFEDVSGPIAPGMDVEVREPESGLVGAGRVTEIDAERQLVYLSVDWDSLHQLSDDGAWQARMDDPPNFMFSGALAPQTVYWSAHFVLCGPGLGGGILAANWLDCAGLPTVVLSTA